MTDAEFLAWAASPDAMRCVLVEAWANVGGAETVRYLSSRDYVTGAAATPASTAYRAVLSGAVTINERLSIDGSASLSAGDVEIDNAGELDTWLDDVWTNRAVKVFVGDPRWPRAAFRQIFDGTIARLGSRSRNKLNLVMRDKLQRLNTPMTSTKLGGSTDNKDRLLPLCFGECHNIKPLLINPATLQYQVHAGPIERIIEVRVNGVPVSHTPNLANGTFTLAMSPSGTVTASVQGEKTGGVYRNTIGELIPHIVTNYGKAVDRFAAGDVDSAQITTFSSGHPQPVGLYLSDRTNVLDTCASLASSVGAQVIMSRAGQLRLLKMALPATGTPTAVGPEQMGLHSLQPSDRPAIRAAVKLGYARNWTPQPGLQTGIPPAHQELFGTEWLTVSATAPAVATLHRLELEATQEDSLLLVEADAQAEADRRKALWSVQRTVYAYDGTPDLMLEQLGGYQTLTASRYGLAGGVSGQIVGLSQDWARCRVNVEVLV